jgi:hypothetical protein
MTGTGRELPFATDGTKDIYPFARFGQPGEIAESNFACKFLQDDK